MKMQNLRADTPVVRKRLESSSAVTIQDVIDHANLEAPSAQTDGSAFTEFRITGVTFRAHGVNFGEAEVMAFGRQLFMIVKPNNPIASVKPDGHFTNL